MFGKKRKIYGVPFKAGFSECRNSGSPTVALENQTVYKRYDKSLVELVQNNKRLSLEKLHGVKLRPTARNSSENFQSVNDRSNDIVDLHKLNESQNLALSAHRQYALLHKCTKHVPRLQLEKRRNQGFGVTVEYNCSQCAFKSSPFKLYDCDSSGACITNIKAGVAFSKSTIKPTDAHFLFATLNINGPSEITLQKHFTHANSVSADVLESSLSENRGIVRDYVAIAEGASMDEVPAVAVALDGQYDRPLYHGYDGQSSSVSEPVIEAETGLNLLISHAVASKLDGSYNKDAVNMFPISVVAVVVVVVVVVVAVVVIVVCQFLMSGIWFWVSLFDIVPLAYQWSGTSSSKESLCILSTWGKSTSLGSFCL